MSPRPTPGRPADELEALFELAGRRAGLSEDEVAPARAAAHAAWRRRLRRDALRRRWALAAALAGVVTALALGISARIRPEPPAPALKAPTPVAELLPARGAPRSLDAGSELSTGADERLALRLASGAELRVDAGSRLRFTGAERIALARGALYLDAAPGGPGVPVVVETPAGVVRHLGTQFEVRLLERDRAGEVGLRVTVREGLVVVDRAGEERTVSAGRVLTLAPDGGARLEPLAPGTDALDWAARAAPPLAIEGLRLAAFLDWATRELGLRWRASDPETARSARETILHGSIEGLTPAEALELVLPGCGVRARRAAGELIIEPEPAP